jgi:hypothetical protein
MFYINRLPVMSFTEATNTFMIHRLLVMSLTEATAMSTLCRLLVVSLMEATVTTMLYRILAMTFYGRLRLMIASFPTRSIRLIGLYLTCWTSLHKEL